MPRTALIAALLAGLAIPAAAAAQTFQGANEEIVITVTPASRDALGAVGRSFKVESVDFPTVRTIRNGNVRQLPGTNGASLGYLKPGIQLEVTGKVKNRPWYEVVYKGQTAYISSGLVKPELPEQEAVGADEQPKQEAPNAASSKPAAPKPATPKPVERTITVRKAPEPTAPEVTIDIEGTTTAADALAGLRVAPNLAPQKTPPSPAIIDTPEEFEKVLRQLGLAEGDKGKTPEKAGAPEKAEVTPEETGPAVPAVPVGAVETMALEGEAPPAPAPRKAPTAPDLEFNPFLPPPSN